MALPQFSGEMRLGSDPTLKFSQAGKAYANFRAVASARKQNQQTQEWETTDEIWVTVTAFGKLAEAVADGIQKGTLVYVAGRVSEEKWTTNEGVERSGVKVLADSVSVVLKAPSVQGQGAAAPAPNPWADDSATSEPPF